MKKRILALLLAVMMVIGTPVAYAEETAAEAPAEVAAAPAATGEAAAPATGESGAAAEPAAETTASTTGDTSEAEAQQTTSNAAPASGTEGEETEAPETAKAEEPAAASTDGTAGTAGFDGSGAGASSNTTEIAVTEGLTVTITEISEAEEEEDTPCAEAEKTLEDSKTLGDETPETSPSPEPTSTPAWDSLKHNSNGETRITSMTLSESVSKEGTLSQKTITIESITLGPSHNSDYEDLSFTFSSTNDDGTTDKYEGYVAGIEVYLSNAEGYAETTKTADQRITDLVAAIADHYYANHCFLLSDITTTSNEDISCVNKYGLSINSIDTEKIASQKHTEITANPDTELCWAASTSNMLEFTGWNDLVTGLSLTDEDKLFDYFASSYTDAGSTSSIGLKWFFNGINDMEDVTTEEDPPNHDHNVVYYNYTKDDGTIKNNCYNSDGSLRFYYTTKTVTIPSQTEAGKTLTLTEADYYYDSSTQPKYFYLENEDGSVRAYFKPSAEGGTQPELLFQYRNGNYYDASGEAMENPGMEYGIGSNWAEEKISDTDITKKNGKLFSQYAEETVATSTIVESGDGYDALYEAAMSLKNGVATGLGIYFYDKNDNYEGGHAITLFGYIKDALSTGWESLKALFVTDSDTTKDRTTTREGAIDMIGMYEVSKAEVSSEICEYPVLLMENYETDCKVPILFYATLQPSDCKKVEETEGTKNAVTTADYIVTDLKVTDRDWHTLYTVTAGDSILFSTELENMSYKNLYDLTDPYVALTYTIVRNGTETETLQQNVPLKSSRVPLEYEEFAPMLSLNKTGDYSLSVTIDGLYATVGGVVTKLQEAYTTNNTYLKNFLFTVIERVQPIIDNPQTTESAPVVSENYDLSKGGDCVIDLPEIKGEVGSVNVNGQTLTSDDYAVTYNLDGTASITFSAAFLKTLLPGTYNFRILDASGKLLTVVKLTVR